MVSANAHKETILIFCQIKTQHNMHRTPHFLYSDCCFKNCVFPGFKMPNSTNLVFVTISIFGTAMEYIHKGEKTNSKCSAMNRAV